MNRFGTRAVVLFAALGMLSVAAMGQRIAAPTSAAAGEPNLLLKCGFEEGLTGWTQAGPAEFAPDSNERHGGKPSVRVTVSAGTDANRVLLWREIPQAAQGDWLKVCGWIRSRDVTDGADKAYRMETLVDLFRRGAGKNNHETGHV